MENIFESLNERIAGEELEMLHNVYELAQRVRVGKRACVNEKPNKLLKKCEK